MPEEWIVRVEGIEYGPVELQTLQEWKQEGRVLPTNEARKADTTVWIRAAEIPELFPAPPVSRAKSEVMGLPARALRIWPETFRIFGRGFPQFFCLTLLLVLPSICAELTRFFLDASRSINVNLRTLLEGGFGFCMLILFLMFWPIYIAGIQILTAEISAGRRPGFFAILNEAVKFWPRIALLCVFVYGSYFFLTVLSMGVILSIALGGPSVVSFFIALLLLAFWIWIIGRLWVNFLFWQQCTVLGRLDFASALRESKALARSGRNIAWYKRPMWRGVFIFSLWSLFVIVLELPSTLPMVRDYFHQIVSTQDPQALVEALQASAKARGSNLSDVALWLVQWLLRPLLGIAFVLLYFEAKSRLEEEGAAAD